MLVVHDILGRAFKIPLAIHMAKSENFAPLILKLTAPIGLWPFLLFAIKNHVKGFRVI